MSWGNTGIGWIRRTARHQDDAKIRLSRHPLADPGHDIRGPEPLFLDVDVRLRAADCLPDAVCHLDQTLGREAGRIALRDAEVHRLEVSGGHRAHALNMMEERRIGDEREGSRGNHRSAGQKMRQFLLLEQEPAMPCASRGAGRPTGSCNRLSSSLGSPPSCRRPGIHSSASQKAPLTDTPADLGPGPSDSARSPAPESAL
jgi:hypothetical protein